MSLYTGLAATASRRLADIGQAITWLHDNNDGSFDPVKGATTAGTTTAYSANGVLLDFNTMLIDGDNILRTDKRFVMEAGDIPEVHDVVTVNSVNYTVVAVRETSPGGVVVLYELQLRS